MQCPQNLPPGIGWEFTGAAAFCSWCIACSDPLGTDQLDSFPTQVLRALPMLWASPSLTLPLRVSWELEHLSLPTLFWLAHETNWLLTFRCSDKISVSQTRGDDLLQRVAKSFNKHSIFRNFTRYLGSPEVTQRQRSQKVDRQCKGCSLVTEAQEMQPNYFVLSLEEMKVK